MRKLSWGIWRLFAILVLLCLVTQLSAQPAKTQMALMTDVAIKPAMVAQFSDGIKAMVEFYAKHGSQYAWVTQMSTDYHCLMISQVADFADVGKMFNEDETLMTEFPAELKALNDKLKGTYDSFRSYIVTYRSDLSIVPEKPREDEGNAFFTFDIWYVIPGAEQEFEKLGKEFAALAKTKKIVDGWRCLVGGLGCDQPVYIWSNLDKGPTEFWAHNAEMWESLGKDLSEVYWKMEKLLRKREAKYMWYQAELSYIPKK